MDAIATTDPDSEKYVDEGVLSGVHYRYSVTAFNANGESNPTGQSNPPVERGSLLKALSVQLAGAGAGRVSSVPVGIDCGSDCHEVYETGTVVVITAEVVEGSRFVEWSGDCSGDDASCSIVITDDMFVVATLMAVSVPPGEAIISVAKTGDGSGLVLSDPVGISCGEACDATFEVGQVVTLSAQAAPGNRFTGWTGSGCTGTGTCVIEAESTHGVTATFLADVAASPIVVTSTSGGTGGPDCTLRDAITAANTDVASGSCPAGDGDDVIQLPNKATIRLTGVDNSSSGNNGLPVITTTITIEGNGSTIERGRTEAEFRLFHVRAGGRLTLEDLTIAKGHGTGLGGGGLLVDSGQAVLIDTAVKENAGDWETDSIGAGIHIIGANSTVTMSESVIADNFGLAIANEGSLWLTDVEMRNNSFEQFVGGLINRGNAYLERVRLENHWGDYSGTLVNTGHMEIVDSTIKKNKGGPIDGRGGISNFGTMEISASQIVENVSNDAGAGGILNSDGAELTIRDSVIANNSASGSGGGISNVGWLEVTDTVVEGNFSESDGGGIANAGYLRLLGSTSIGSEADGNTSFGLGGGIYAGRASYTFVCATCTVTENEALDNFEEGGAPGGGIYAVGAQLEIVDPNSVFGNTPDQIVQ